MSKLTEQQRTAVESVDRNVLVSAGAGSGKTHVLVERYVESLRRSPDLSPGDLIAVTYTKKAASEMRMRVKMRMEDLVREAQSGEERQRWTIHRQEVDGARIGTIHSLCESLLKAFPAEAGCDPQFQVLEDLEAAEILESTIEEALLGPEPNSTFQRELMESYPIDNIKEWVSSLMRSSLQFEAACRTIPSLTDHDLQRHVDKLLTSLWRSAAREIFAGSRINDLLEEMDSPLLPDGSKLVPMRQDVLRLASAADDLSGSDQGLKECIGCLQALDKAVDLRLGGKDDASKTVKAALKEIRGLVRDALDGVPDGLVESDALAIAHIRALISVTESALAIYNREKGHAQKLDFNDLIRHTYDLLSRPGSAARSYYSGHTAAVLVDEFQDTNTIQSDILAMLAGPSTRLFLIGDDKQSIYKFQGADVSTFNRWRDHFRAIGSTGRAEGRDDIIYGPCSVERLDVSFRSHPEVVRFVNSVFEKLLAGGETAIQTFEARHQALQSARTADDDRERVEIVILDAATEDEKPNSQLCRDFESRAIADWILEKVTRGGLVEEKNGKTRPIEFGDFAVLVPRNADFAPIARVLAQAGIPYVATGGAGFLERQEVYDIENFLRFLSCPTDSHSLLGVLRSPMFALSDDVLHSLASRKPGSLWRAAQGAADSGEAGYVFLRPLVAALRRFLMLAKRVSLPELLRAIIRDTNYDIAIVGVPNSHTRSRNLWKLVSMATEREYMSPGEFAQCLESMRDLKVKQLLAPVDSGNSVKLMTIHSSKGLEFPAVIVAVLGTDAAKVRGKLRIHKDYGIALDCTRSGEDKPAFFRAASLIEERMAVAEGKRLLYVAMTRARDYLALFLDKRARNVPSFRSWLDEVLSLKLSGDCVAAGSYSLTVRSGTGRYLVSRVDSESAGGAVQPQTSPHRTGEAVIPAMNTDLIEQFESAITEPPIPWQEILRVTPGGAELPRTLTGRFFHALMERFCQRLKVLPRAVLEAVACSEAIGVVHKAMIKELVDAAEPLLEKFYSSPLFDLMQTAQAVFSEPPYVLVASDRARVSRRPDLLLEDAEGQWHVIDFKTDRFSADQIEHQAKSHRRQLETYAEDIKTLTEVVVRKSVYFAEHGILYELVL